MLTNITPLAVEGAEALARLQVKAGTHYVVCAIFSGISEIVTQCGAVLSLNEQASVIAVVGP